MKNIQISVSSLTGNTKKLAEALIRECRLQGYDPEVLDVREACRQEGTRPDDLVILCFWCRKAGLDDLTKAYVDRLSGSRILAFGTMGSYAHGSYADQVRENVKAYVSGDNHLKGLFLCRGRIDPERTEKRRSLPKSHPHYLDDAGYERHLSSRSHPDSKDLEQAVAFLRDRMNW